MGCPMLSIGQGPDVHRPAVLSLPRDKRAIGQESSQEVLTVLLGALYLSPSALPCPVNVSAQEKPFFPISQDWVWVFSGLLLCFWREANWGESMSR